LRNTRAKELRRAAKAVTKTVKPSLYLQVRNRVMRYISGKDQAGESIVKSMKIGGTIVLAKGSTRKVYQELKKAYRVFKKTGAFKPVGA